MASFGKVLDLFDDRCLELQDVVGNVEPLPTLVPYDEYKQNVLVYRIDTNHDIYMALMQEFTERKAREVGRELWTWCVQWQVEEAPADDSIAHHTSSKKPRLESQQRKSHAIDIVERRVLKPNVMLQEDMLRILIDIVQVDSTVVPNFIEFLYRWIDFYEGDGKALQAAMRWEIPSLWEFEYHPLVLPSDSKQSNSTKKMREKPNLASLEEKIKQSERLQYREVHYGIKPPKLWEPLPPLINLPRDQQKRTKYYAACFKSRQRAFNLLVEAGVTAQQINNYDKLQDVHPRDTPLDGDGGGLRHYQKDAKAAQAYFAKKENEMVVRAKHMEIAISNRLAVEAQLAACGDIPEGMVELPAIPTTPSYNYRPDMAGGILRRMRLKCSEGEERINIVPKPLQGLLQSQLFAGARNTDWLEDLRGSSTTAKQTALLEKIGRSTEESGSSTYAVASSLGSAASSQPAPSTIYTTVYGQQSTTQPHQYSQPLQSQYLPQTPTIPPSSPSSLLPDFGTQTTTTLPFRPPVIPILTPDTVYFPAPDHPLPQRRVASDPSSLGTLLSQHANLNTAPVFNGQHAQAGSALPHPHQHHLASRPSLPYLPPLLPLQGFSTRLQPLNSIPSALPPPPPPPPQQQQQQTPPPLLPTTPSTNSQPKAPTPVLIYLPHSLRPGNTVGPAGRPLGNAQALETDAILLGYSVPGSGTLVLSRALFLPLGIWDSVLRRVRSGAWSVVETYAGGQGGRVVPGVSHGAVYEKLRLAHGVMVEGADRREDRLTKRWRASKGPMSWVERGAVWEGWAVGVASGIEMDAGERGDAVKWEGWVDGKSVVSAEMERRRRELDELMAEEEAEEERKANGADGDVR